jgi:hypothetical protein
MIPRLYTYTPFCPSYIILALARLDYNPAYIYTSLTFLNSSVEARAFGSSDLTLSIAVGGGVRQRSLKAASKGSSGGV